jgi:AraC-like DNA-binding protein
MVVFSGIVIYSILILKEIKNAKLNQKDPFQLEIYQWARFVFIASFAMAIFMIINVIVKSTGSNANFYLTAFGPFLWLRLLFFTIILIRIVFYKRLLWGLPNFKRVSLSISKQLVAMPNTELIDAKLSNTEEDGQSERILLNESQAKQYQLVLSQFFQSQTHIYTELEFNLTHLAHHTKIPKHHWAYYFQYHSETSFVELRNKNRIEFSKNIMRLPAFRNRTIEAIGNASGFSSRVTYFNAFKKYESITPSEYWESLKKDSTENAPELN